VSDKALVPRDAATVMLVRDGAPRDDIDSRIEVFMLRRHLDSVFLGGAYVFPGGAVDEHDRHADLEAVCAGRTIRRHQFAHRCAKRHLPCRAGAFRL